MRHLTVDEILELHRLVFLQSGGAIGIRDLGALDSAVAQTRVAFGGTDLYPTIVEKAAALGYSLVMNHPFVDGNKRVGHAAMETFLVLNGYEIRADVDEQEKTILRLAAGTLSRDEFVDWLGGARDRIQFAPDRLTHVIPLRGRLLLENHRSRRHSGRFMMRTISARPCSEP